MDILFVNNRLRKELSDSALLVCRYGDRRGRLIRQRLGELRAAETLADIRNLPGPHCHELSQDREGQLAVYQDHPYRLVFAPANDPWPARPDGGLDWALVTAITILGVVDYHG